MKGIRLEPNLVPRYVLVFLMLLGLLGLMNVIDQSDDIKKVYNNNIEILC